MQLAQAWRRVVRPTPLYLLGLLALASLASVGGAPVVQDEEFHLREIQALLQGKWRGEVPMLPGYHGLVALLAAPLRWRELPELRIVSWCWSALSMAAVYFAARGIQPREAALRTLQIFLLPIVLPIVSLLYTDTVSLGCSALALGLLVRRRVAASGWVAAASLLVRQTNVAWLLCLLAWSYCERARTEAAERPSWLQELQRHAGFAAGALGFLGFFTWNRGPVLSTSPAAPSSVLSGEGYLHVENGLFAIGFCALLLLPWSLQATRAAVLRVRAARGWMAVPVGVGVLGILSFRAGHEWNAGEPHYYLASGVVQWLQSGFWPALCGLVLLSWGALVLGTTRWLHGFGLPLSCFWFAATAPYFLLAPRYQLPVIAAALLLRPMARPSIEYATTAWLAVVGVIAAIGVRFDLFSFL